jgi:hypothetical protein
LRFGQAYNKSIVLEKSTAPLALVGCFGGLFQLLGGCLQALLRPLQILLKKLDASVQTCQITLQLQDRNKRVCVRHGIHFM